MYKGDPHPAIVQMFLFDMEELQHFINRPDINVLEIVDFDKSEYGYYVTIMYKKIRR